MHSIEIGQLATHQVCTNFERKIKKTSKGVSCNALQPQATCWHTSSSWL